MGIYRLIILFLLGALTLQVEAQDEFVPIDGEPRIKVVFYKKVQKEFYPKLMSIWKNYLLKKKKTLTYEP